MCPLREGMTVWRTYPGRTDLSQEPIHGRRERRLPDQPWAATSTAYGVTKHVMLERLDLITPEVAPRKMLFLLVSAQLSSSLCPTFGALDRRHVSIWLGSWPFVWD